MWIRRLSEAVEIHMPAKVNLFLEILAKRPDGFHELETLLTSVGICDTIFCERIADPRIELECRWGTGCEAFGSALTQRCAAHGWSNDLYGTLPPVQENLAWKAANRLRERAGIQVGARLTLRKRIPAAAGLGGASADAAATLLALNEVWRLGWSCDQLAAVAAELGSDVPFFLTGGSAVCSGRGELVSPVERLPPAPLVVMRPPEGLSTPSVYRRCKPAVSPRSVGPLLEGLRRANGRAIRAGLKNQLEEPARELSPWIKKTAQWLERHGVTAQQMSGSGTSYVAVCRTARHARRIAGALRTVGIGPVWSTRTPAD